jgi:hypothetical protein
MSPFQAPAGTPLSTDELGRASCMSLLFSLNKMTPRERAEHLARHAASCEDDPRQLPFCPICSQLAAAHDRMLKEEALHECLATTTGSSGTADASPSTSARTAPVTPGR